MASWCNSDVSCLIIWRLQIHRFDKIALMSKCPPKDSTREVRVGGISLDVWAITRTNCVAGLWCGAIFSFSSIPSWLTCSMQQAVYPSLAQVTEYSRITWRIHHNSFRSRVIVGLSGERTCHKAFAPLSTRPWDSLWSKLGTKRNRKKKTWAN